MLDKDKDAYLKIYSNLTQKIFSVALLPAAGLSVQHFCFLTILLKKKNKNKNLQSFLSFFADNCYADQTQMFMVSGIIFCVSKKKKKNPQREQCFIYRKLN